MPHGAQDAHQAYAYYTSQGSSSPRGQLAVINMSVNAQRLRRLACVSPRRVQPVIMVWLEQHGALNLSPHQVICRIRYQSVAVFNLTRACIKRELKRFPVWRRQEPVVVLVAKLADVPSNNAAAACVCWLGWWCGSILNILPTLFSFD